MNGTPARPHRGSLRLLLMAAAFYAGLTFILLHAILFANGEKVAGFDYFNYQWNFWWLRHVLNTPGLSLYESNYVLYPTLNNFGYHALTPFWYPVWALIEPIAGTLTAVNVILVIGCFLNGFLLYLWLREEDVPAGLALIGGAVLQTLPIVRYFYFNTHLNLMDWFWLPFLLLIWKRLAGAADGGFVARAARWALIMGAAIWGLGLTDLQFPIFAAFVVVPYGLLTLWRAGGWAARARLAVFGVIAVIVGSGLLLGAGPLPMIARFQGVLAPGAAQERPGVTFPAGFLTMSETWWQWDTPSTGAFVTIVFVISLIAAVIGARPVKVNTVNLVNAGTSWRGGRWFWLGVAIPPLLLSMGATISIAGIAIPMPFRVMHQITNGMFRMPWRLAPIFVIAAMLFAGVVWRARWRRLSIGARVWATAALLFALFAFVRVFETAPLEPPLPAYEAYEQMRGETGVAYQNYVVLEVPVAVGTGEVLLGDARAIQYQWYGMTHEKRMINGFISRAPTDDLWRVYQVDPLLTWLGQRRLFDVQTMSDRLYEMVYNYPVGYIVVHRDRLDANSPTPGEILGFLNGERGTLCAPIVEYEIVVYRGRWHPHGCPARPPQETAPGVYTIDIGAPEDARFLLGGWYWPETVGGLVWRWTGLNTPAARLTVDLEPGAYRVTIDAQAFHQAQTISVSLNDQGLGSAVLESEILQALTFETPADVTGDGRDLILSIAYEQALAPRDVGRGDDARTLAAAIDRITFERIAP